MTTTYMHEQKKRTTLKVYDTALGVDYEGGIESITRVGSTATANKPNHGFSNGKVVTIAGADQSAYNIAATVANASQNAFDYTVAGTPTTPATGIIQVTDADQSIWANLPEAVQIESIGATTTVKLEVCMSLELGWRQLGADLASADNGKIIAVDAKYNFVRLRRSAGTGAVKAHAQL